MLSIFSLSILIGSYLGATALNTIIDSATTISIGSEYHALKDFDNLSSVLEISKHIDKYDRCATVMELHASYTPYQGIPRGVILLTITNTTRYLSSTYWSESLGIGKDFSHIMKMLNNKRTIALMSSAGFVSYASEVMDRIKSSNRLSICISGVCINETVEIVGELSLIPGFTFRGDAVVISGPWILDKLEESQVEYLYTTLHVFYRDSENITSELKDMGFNVIDKEKVISSPDYRAFSCLVSMPSASSLPQSLVLIGLSIILSSFIAWSASKEVSKVYLLLRIRGARSRDILRIILSEWGLLVIISIIFSIALGVSMGLGIMSLTAFPTIPLTIEVNGEYITIDLSKGAAKPYIPLEGWLAIVIAVITLILVPSLSAIMVYRGTIRERLVEVR